MFGIDLMNAVVEFLFFALSVFCFNLNFRSHSLHCRTHIKQWTCVKEWEDQKVYRATRLDHSQFYVIWVQNTHIHKFIGSKSHPSKVNIESSKTQCRTSLSGIDAERQHTYSSSECGFSPKKKNQTGNANPMWHTCMGLKVYFSSPSFSLSIEWLTFRL